MEDLKKRLDLLTTAFRTTWKKLDLNDKFIELESLEEKISDPNLWNNPDRAKKLNEEFSRLDLELTPWRLLDTQVADLAELLDLCSDDLLDELDRQLSTLETDFAELKQTLRFTGEFDKNHAILRLTAGVGGTEAMDWASMLERMYLRFFEKIGFKSSLVERVPGEEAGIKTAVYEVRGQNVYGTLKSEHGVHRLVRLSPFNADNLRQTSFALVEILPIIDSDDEIVIDDKDLRIDVYHSGGHGGQSVNTTNSAVRITHLPTNTVVAIQNERSQLQNKEKAMEILRGKLAQLKLEQQAESIDKLRAGESAKWGQQIRNYILQPYKLVKDTRTKHEETDVDAVLDGNLMPFINAFLES
ncbi:peptide chain release factor 2 [Candidatus Saccharibacteria bacterium]|nr:peptide chain release factor 2 [Candidatus Saccharibacteria bacterium]